MSAMDDAWAEFDRQCIPAELGAGQRRSLSLAFYAGASVGLGQAAREVSESATPGQAMERLHLRWKECRGLIFNVAD